MSSIVWLSPKRPYSEDMTRYLRKAMLSVQISTDKIFFANLHTRAQSLLKLKGKSKAKQILDPDNALLAKQYLNEMIVNLKPKLIVINDLASLWLISGTEHSLNAARGSVYFYEGIPCIVIDEPRNIFAKAEGKWIFSNDLQKIKRWYFDNTRTEPAFQYAVCRTLADVQNFVSDANKSDAIAIDCETKSGFITCIGYTCLRDGKIFTWLVPFYHPFKEGGCFWDTEEEELSVWELIKLVHANDAQKVLQNGTYDAAYFGAYGVSLRNYLADTSVLIHSIWLEAPKKLNFISSLFIDNCKYWKDESKGSKEEGWGRSAETLERYWRYCALDCYNTLLNARMLIKTLLNFDWAIANYDTLFRLSVGPCYAMSMTGLRVDRDRHRQMIDGLSAEADQELEKIRIMTDDPEFNPKAPAQVASFLYDVLGAKPTRLQSRRGSKYGPRSTDEKVLKLIKEQPNPLLEIFIDQLLATKKPANNISKYGSFRKLTYRERFLYSLSATGTETTRFSGSSHQFWYGTNPQNIPGKMREMFVADDDYVLVDIDYSASDDRFIAYESQDLDKIKLVESGMDAHCYHASFFFKMPYEKLLAAKKNNEDWCVHPIEGVRSNTKRVVHGRNFAMGAETLYNTMGREAVIASARFLGYKNADELTDKELIGVCRTFCEAYDNPKTGLYKRIRPWQNEIAEECASNGNLLTSACGATRLFFGNPRKDNKVQRDMAAFKGQAGTASNINRCLLDMFYSGLIDMDKVHVNLQVHDSLTFMVHKDHLHVIPEIIKAMEKPITLHGREFIVPVDVELGLSWSKEMMRWHEGVTYEDVVAFEKKTFGSKYVDISTMSVADFANMEISI